MKDHTLAAEMALEVLLFPRGFYQKRDNKLAFGFNEKKQKKNTSYVDMMVFPEEVGAQTMAECFLSTSLSTRFCHSSSFHPVVKRDRGGSLGVRAHQRTQRSAELENPPGQTRLNDAIWEAPRSPCTRFRSFRVDPR